jgi:hypothetical protein
MLRTSLLLLFVVVLHFEVVADMCCIPVASPSDKDVIAGHSSSFTISDSYNGCMMIGCEETEENCEWRFDGGTVYSDESCTVENSSVATIATPAETTWTTCTSYTKSVHVVTHTSGICWLKFKLRRRLGNSGNGEVKTTNAVKLKAVNISISAPQWLGKGKDDSISITYTPANLNSGTITLSGCTNLYEFTNTQNGTVEDGNDGNQTLSWVLNGTQNGTITLSVKGKKTGSGKLTAKHFTSEAKAESNAGVYTPDVICDSLGEEQEETPGVFIGTKKRKSLSLKAEPTNAGGKVILSSGNLKLYNAETGGDEITKREWNVSEIPQTIYVIGTTASNSLRDIEVTLTWKEVSNVELSDSAKVTVIAGDLSAKDLFNDTNNATIEDAYVHWNIDNDDGSSTVASESAKHPGGDYKQNFVTGEDDLLSLNMNTSASGLNFGTIELSIDANAKIWKSTTKGPSATDTSNLVLSSGKKSWNLSDALQKSDFTTISSSLFVEGVNEGESDFKLEFIPPAGSKIELDKIKYHFIAANCGNQPNIEKPIIGQKLGPKLNPDGSFSQALIPIYGDSQKEIVKKAFPKIIECEYSILNNRDKKYNCIAHSIGVNDKVYVPLITDRVLEFDANGNLNSVLRSVEEKIIGTITYIGIDKKFGDGDKFFRVELTDDEKKQGKKSDIDEFYKFHGFFPNASNTVEAEVVYFNGFHAAKRRNNCSCGAGKWFLFESKLGQEEVIEHKIVSDNSGPYGKPIRFYKK